jgi:hypothetical protein
MTSPDTSNRGDNQRNVLVVAGVVILAVVVTIAAVLVLGREPETAGPGTPSAPESAPPSEAPPSDEPSVAPEPSDSDDPTPDALPDGWTLVHQIDADGGRWSGGHLAFGNAGFLAIGRRTEGGEGGPRVTDNAMFLSADGQEWTEVPYPAAEVGEYFAMALSEAADGSFVFHVLADRQDGTPSLTVSLRSTDGTTWEEIETGLPESIAINSISEGPAGYLLAGDQTGSTNPSLWLSADGLTWELVHEFSQDEQFVQLSDADGGEDGYVVMGRRIVPDGPYQRFTFASADGREWVERAEPFGADDQEFVGDVGVSSFGADWVATLAQPGNVISTWTSSDGLTWTESGSIQMGERSIAVAGLLEEIGDELISSPGGTPFFIGDPGVFSSTDGAAWSPVDMGADAWLGELAIGNGVAVVTGTIVDADGGITGGIWIRATD